MGIKEILTPEKLKELYIDQRLSSDKIGELLGYGSTTILRYLKKYNIPLRNWKKNIDISVLQKLYLTEKLSTRQIAKKLDVNQTTVLQYLKDYDIPIRKDTIQLEEKLLKELYLEQNLTAHEIAKKLGIGRTTVQKFLQKYHITKDRHIKERLDSETLKELYINQNLSTTIIAEKFNVNPVTIGRYLKTYNIIKSEKKQIESKENTNLLRHKIRYPSQLPEVKNKVKDTNMRIYGTPCTLLLDTCKNAHVGQISALNRRWQSKIEDTGHKTRLEFRIDMRSYDIQMIDTNILIEINPTATHNSTKNIFPSKSKPLDKDYHYQKSKLATENGYHCIHVWDWDDEQKILDLLKKKEKIQGRKTEVKEVPVHEANEFNNLYHLQNTCKGQKVCLGLYYQNKLVSLMSFGKPRYNKNYQWELLRYTTHPEYMILGGAEKLFKHFLEQFNPDSIITYCDYSKFSGQVYKKLGFTFTKHNKSSCHWIKGVKRITQAQLNKYGFDKLLGKEYGCYGKGTDNQQLMLEHGFVQMYDCGQLVFIWSKDNI